MATNHPCVVTLNEMLFLYSSTIHDFAHHIHVIRKLLLGSTNNCNKKENRCILVALTALREVLVYVA